MDLYIVHSLMGGAKVQTPHEQSLGQVSLVQGRHDMGGAGESNRRLKADPRASRL